MSQSLSGIRVIDLSTEIAEATGRILADLGAEVIKIEKPGGCESRFVAPFVGGGAAGREVLKPPMPCGGSRGPYI